MRLSSLLSSLAAFRSIALAADVFINNKLAIPVYLTAVDGTGYHGNLMTIPANGSIVLGQSWAPGPALKISPEPKDIDEQGKGILTLGYNLNSAGWIYYDIGVHNYYPFDGARVKLSGAGGANDWSDGHAHTPYTIGYHGQTDLTLDLGY